MTRSGSTPKTGAGSPQDISRGTSPPHRLGFVQPGPLLFFTMLGPNSTIARSRAPRTDMLLQPNAKH
eukprot:4558053-Amphidinium_carterae.1